eukprot:Partr_v1_DN27996_c1_g1_i4_m12044 putative mitochondrial 54S ribosomal protein YmL3
MISAISAKRLAHTQGVVLRKITDQEFRQFYPKKNVPALAAIKARLGLELNVADLHNCCYFERDSPRGIIGRKIIERECQNGLAARYPNLPALIADNALGQYISKASLSQVARKFGYQHVTDATSAHDDILSSAVEKTIGLIDEKLGGTASSKFVNDYVLRRELDERKVVSEFENPSEIIKQLYTSDITTRLLNESGRQSPNPIFTVGLFAGTQKIGEGAGQSICLAEHEARLNALKQKLFAKK